MYPPQDWTNPISAKPGQIQRDVPATQLLPARADLQQSRLDIQRALLESGQQRTTMIQVTSEGVIWDGHHFVRAAAEKSLKVVVLVVPLTVPAVAASILVLPVG